MKQVFKYKLGVVGLQEVELPEDAQILSIQTQHESICLWALVDQDKTKEMRRITLIGTGHYLPEGDHEFLGTVQELGGDLVWHLFERKQ